MVLTSYDSYRELREAELPDLKITSILQDTARALLLA